ncbi:hypothetical protein [Bradyrhizobium sp. JYMT SZCCT0428]|nr:hypothetical protein [Bradyrhizobium sp. JYMT SZCCT0428]MBR1150123.1 hypothetical protein [Bradyrhizobium sp. JYMT SZCCT0428]
MTRVVKVLLLIVFVPLGAIAWEAVQIAATIKGSRAWASLERFWWSHG